MLNGRERIIVEAVIQQLRLVNLPGVEQKVIKPLEILLEEPPAGEFHTWLRRLEVARSLAKDGLT